MDKYTYQDFVKYFFDRPDYGKNEKWFFQSDYEDPKYDLSNPMSNKKLFIDFFCMAMQDIKNLSETYSEKQFYYALQYMIDWSCGSSFRDYFFYEDVPISNRVLAVSLMYEVFEKIFSKECSNIPEPKDLSDISYNRLCFMWWEMFSTIAMPQSQDIKKISQAILWNLDKILSLDNVICKKSALHGLGLLYSDYSEMVEEIIVRHEKEIPDCLSIYAHDAIRGNVQ